MTDWFLNASVLLMAALTFALLAGVAACVVLYAVAAVVAGAYYGLSWSWVKLIEAMSAGSDKEGQG